MGMIKDFMVAVELGSSRITGVAGQKNADGSLRVLAYASEDASAAIRKGVVLNIEKTALAITSIVNKLEAQLDASIGKVYVGISGQSVHSVCGVVSKQLGEETLITKEIVDSLARTNQTSVTGETELLEVIPQEYKVGSSLQADPVGVMASHIEARYVNVVARGSVRSKIERSFAQADVKIADLLVTPIALAKVVLTDAELRAGCVLVDFGAATTTVQVWKDHILRHLAVIPLGGDSINRDICSLQLEDASAEQLKVEHGSCYIDEETPSDAQPYVYTSLCGKKVSDRLLSEIIEGRQEEIIANVWHQVQLSGYVDKLLSGMVVTGGGAAMRGLEQLAIKKTGLSKYRFASYVVTPVESTTPEMLARNGRQCTVLGLLSAARENCREIEISGGLFAGDGESASPQSTPQDEKLAEALIAQQLLEAQKEAEAARLAQEAADAEKERQIREENMRREKEQLEQQRLQEKERRDREKREKFRNSFLGKMSERIARFGNDILNGEN